MRNLTGFAWIGLTVVLTVYGQMVFKWRVDAADAIPAGLGARIEYAVRLALDPWMISVILSVFLASVTWWAALRIFDLSFAYPFMSLSFVLVLVLSAAMFGDRLTTPKLAGIVLVVFGLVVASRA
jgi:multidrug transporter EmrE-like cation transporter